MLASGPLSLRVGYLVVTKPSVVATPYPEINCVLEELLSRVRAILGRRFVGMYLDGSLAIGDFEADKSDLDFVVVTDGGSCQFSVTTVIWPYGTKCGNTNSFTGR